jgi:S1-C subfamily serine protease
VVVAAAGVAVGAVALTKNSSTNSAAPPSSAQGTSNWIPTTPVESFQSFAAAYASLKTAVVKITTVGCDGNGYEGSGFVIDAHHIVTAGHVIEGSQSMTVAIGSNPVPVQIIGLDASGDVALLQSDSAIAGSYIPLATVDPEVGARVAAIGFPLGGGLTMTQGSVSALQQSIEVNSTNLAGLVQTDTPINHGNSGGPLVGLNGQASGIVDALNTQANATGYAISPQYASSEVSHWIKSPESIPLPLCTNPNPLGTTSASPAPTTPSAPSSGAGNAIPAVPLSSEGCGCRKCHPSRSCRQPVFVDQTEDGIPATQLRWLRIID